MDDVKRLELITEAVRYCQRIGLHHGKGKLVYDHAIPFRYFQEELLALDPVTPKTVAEALRGHGTRVLITRTEDALLSKSGLAQKMPEGWDGINALARYEAVGIKPIENK